MPQNDKQFKPPTKNPWIFESFLLKLSFDKQITEKFFWPNNFNAWTNRISKKSSHKTNKEKSDTKSPILSWANDDWLEQKEYVYSYG